MAKKPKPPERSCRDCIHECACVMQCGYRPMADENASRCPNYTTLRRSAEYFIGYEEWKKSAEHVEPERRRAYQYYVRAFEKVLELVHVYDREFGQLGGSAAADEEHRVEVESNAAD